MTKKDYAAVARALVRALGYSNRCRAARELAQEFAQANPRFDREKFLLACEVQLIE